MKKGWRKGPTRVQTLVQKRDQPRQEEPAKQDRVAWIALAISIFSAVSTVAFSYVQFGQVERQIEVAYASEVFATRLEAYEKYRADNLKLVRSYLNAVRYSASMKELRGGGEAMVSEYIQLVRESEGELPLIMTFPQESVSTVMMLEIAISDIQRVAETSSDLRKASEGLRTHDHLWTIRLQSGLNEYADTRRSIYGDLTALAEESNSLLGAHIWGSEEEASFERNYMAIKVSDSERAERAIAMAEEFDNHATEGEVLQSLVCEWRMIEDQMREELGLEPNLRDEFLREGIGKIDC